jgi:hypothetical protein
MEQCDRTEQYNYIAITSYGAVWQNRAIQLYCNNKLWSCVTEQSDTIILQ